MALLDQQYYAALRKHIHRVYILIEKYIKEKYEKTWIQTQTFNCILS